MSANIITNNNELSELALKGLYNVYDPEVGVNIVDLGLVYQINFNEVEKKLNLIMTLTTQFCPMGESITNDATQSLTNAFPDWQVNVELTFEPPWDYTKISPEGNKLLGR